jgi:hypothetical protein
VPNPLEQAGSTRTRWSTRWSATRSSCSRTGRHQGKLAFPWSYGVVLPNITRKQFDKRRAAPRHRAAPRGLPGRNARIGGARGLQSRLWDMFPYMMRGVMSLPQLDRVRWILFPEVRVPTQGALFDETTPTPSCPTSCA